MVIESVKGSYQEEHIKYDYGRMVFQNITELVRAQKLKAEYEQLESPGLRGALSKDMSLFSIASVTSLSKKSNKAIAKNFQQNSFNRIRDKFWQNTKVLRKQKFHISNMQVFKIIDGNYDKFVGRNKNSKLINMIRNGNYISNNDIPPYNLQQVIPKEYNPNKEDSININQTLKYNEPLSGQTLADNKEIEEKLPQMMQKAIINQELIEKIYSSMEKFKSDNLKTLAKIEKRALAKLEEQEEIQQSSQSNEVKENTIRNNTLDKSLESRNEFKVMNSGQKSPIETSKTFFEEQQQNNGNNTVLGKTFLQELENDEKNQSSIINKGDDDNANQSLEQQEDFLDFQQQERGSLLSNYQRSRLILRTALGEDQPSEAYDYSRGLAQQNSLMRSYRNANISRQSGRLKIKNKGIDQSLNSFTVSINASDVANKLKEKSGMKSEDKESFLSIGNNEYSKLSEKDQDANSQLEDEDEQEVHDEVMELQGLDQESFVINLHKKGFIKKNNEGQFQHHPKNITQINNSLDYSLYNDDL